MSHCQETRVTMTACVRQVCPCCLLVCDLCTGQEVLVRTDAACCFCPGDRICIRYNGAMTRSRPPEITARCIEPLEDC